MQNRRASKVKPAIEIPGSFNENKPEIKTEKQSLDHFSTKYTGIQSLINVSTSPSTKIKKKHLESMNITGNEQDVSAHTNTKSTLETSIRQKSDLEKWSKAYFILNINRDIFQGYVDENTFHRLSNVYLLIFNFVNIKL